MSKLLPVGAPSPDPRHPCARCGHVQEWHRTAGGSCTYDLPRKTVKGKTTSYRPCRCEGMIR